MALRRIGNGSLQPFPAAIPERRNRLNGDRVSDTDLEEDIKTRVAWLYYMESMTQDQVAQELGLTRSRVLRMLAASRQDGTVQICVTSKLSRCVSWNARSKINSVWSGSSSSHGPRTMPPRRN